MDRTIAELDCATVVSHDQARGGVPPPIQDREGNEYGITRQREDVLRLVQARGWSVAAEYVDNDTSATARKPRPAFDAMMAAVDAGSVDVIAARHVDRLVRRLATSRPSSNGARLTASSSSRPRTPWTPPRTEAVSWSGFSVPWPRGEMERKSARQRSAVAQAAKRGGGLAGAGRSGTRRTASPSARTRRRPSGWATRPSWPGSPSPPSCGRGRRRLTATQTGKPWDRSGVRDVLLNARNAGLRRHAPEGTHGTYATTRPRSSSAGRSGRPSCPRTPGGAGWPSSRVRSGARGYREPRRY
ncbi:recombinase family protein [Rhodococcus hoagii]|nr:recombinase family protein [Prescottella equi]